MTQASISQRVVSSEAFLNTVRSLLAKLVAARELEQQEEDELEHEEEGGDRIVDFVVVDFPNTLWVFDFLVLAHEVENTKKKKNETERETV
ncbi:unnamed protein product [Thlaspi arvense]|uniref:Uncharacterized protein n=1 Tax=Thlaspi arvense TaxID=13288 RepID=A0AAU9T9J6_THLAR|nr:unnamed protein product [Thlaspi arvense]